MKYTDKQLAAALIDACCEDSPNMVAKSFVTLLSENDELYRFRNILSAIESVWKDRYGVATIQLETAHAISSSLRTALTELAKGAEVAERVDAELIGGARLRIDDKIIDGSIQGHLSNLKQTLSQA